MPINGGRGGVVDEAFGSKMMLYSLKVGLIFENVLNLEAFFCTKKRRLVSKTD